MRKSFAHKRSVQRASNASWLISYSDVLLAFTAFLRFLTDLQYGVGNLQVRELKPKFGTVVKNQFNEKHGNYQKLDKKT